MINISGLREREQHDKYQWAERERESSMINISRLRERESSMINISGLRERAA